MKSAGSGYVIFQQHLDAYCDQIRYAIPVIFAAIAASCDSRLDAFFGLLTMTCVLFSPQWRFFRHFRLRLQRGHPKKVFADEEALNRQIDWHLLPSLLVMLWFCLKIAFWELFR